MMEGLPPAKRVTSRVSKGFKALAKNEQKMSEIRQNAISSRFFDGSAPGTRKHIHFNTVSKKIASTDKPTGNKREDARALYEAYCHECCDCEPTNIQSMWDKNTFVHRTKEFLEGIIHIARGKFEKRIKTGTLWSMLSC